MPEASHVDPARCSPLGASTIALAACGALLLGAPALAGQESTADEDGREVVGTERREKGRTFSGRAGELEVPVPRLEDPGVSVDGELDEPAWSRAAVLTGFTQYEPVEGVPARERTEVLVFYTPDAMYFGIRAYDRRPEAIRATVAERDRSAFNDDWARLMLDTYDDRRRAYLFYVNPLGIQTDGLWIEGLNRGGGGGFRFPIDFNPDFIWESRGRVTDEGWVAEIRIPYVSLQFEPKPVQSWGFNVARGIERNGYDQAWAPLTDDRSSTLAQSGRLTGLQGLTPKKLFELNPVVTGRLTGEREEETDAFVRGDPEPEFGANLRYGITRNLMLGGTYNPDFSQVEADADQIAVNERFALFFPEKRPFFLEGTEIFESPNRLVHTRQIVDPLGGAKVTGKIGGLNVAYLGALDESPVTLGDGEHEALFNLARVRRDVGTGSTLGLLYTDRTATGGGAFNRVAAADARFLFGGRYTLTAQVGGSWTREGTDEASDDLDSAGETGSGGVAPSDGVGTSGGEAPGTAVEPAAFAPLWSLALERSGRAFGWQLRVEDVGPQFRTESGFIRRTGDLRANARVERTFYGESGAAIESWGVEARIDGFFDHPDFWSGREMTPFEREEELEASVSLAGEKFVELGLRHGYFRFRPEEYEDYQVLETGGELRPFAVPEPLDHMLAASLRTRSRLSNSISVNGNLSYRETPIFREAARGRELLLRPGLDLQPTPSLSVDLSYAFSRIWRSRDGTLFSRADIPRLEAQYQFSRSLFFRGIVQYNLSSREALRDPRTEESLAVDGELAGASEFGSFQTQLLLSYEPSPGTIFFIGWSRLEEGDRSFDPGRMEPASEGFFAKLSYLLRI